MAHARILFFARRSIAVLAALVCAGAVGACSAAPAPSGPAASEDTSGVQVEDNGPSGKAAAAPDAPPPFRYYDVNHVLGTGQSLSLGAMGTPALSLTQPFKNLMFDTGLEASAEQPSAFVPLVETATFLDAPVETPSSAFANLVTKLAAEGSLASQLPAHRAHDVLVSLHGVSGAAYPEIGKGTSAYQHGLAQVRAAKAIAEAQGKSYIVRAITVVHGESDGWQNRNTDYAKALLEWQSSYDADIKAITGQTTDIPMLHSQYSAWSSIESTPSNIIPFLQLEAARQAPGKIVIVGPKYFLPYASDGLHLTNEGYRWLGEYYAKVYARQILEGKRWEPVRPKQITRVGNVVTVTFFVPAAPLVLDTELVSNPGSYGFEMSDDSGAAPAITKVAVTAPDTLTITLASAPKGANKRLRYAYAGKPGSTAGPATGPRGNLRDSDPTASRYGYKLYDWCVHFDESMP